MAKRAPAQRRPRKAKPNTKGLMPSESILENLDGSAIKAATVIAKVDCRLVASYKEPLGGHPVLLANLPVDAHEPPAFHYARSDAHPKRVDDVIEQHGRFLDPVIQLLAPGQGFWTPNGRHRLAAMRRLGAKSIAALIVADREIAWQIL